MAYRSEKLLIALAGLWQRSVEKLRAIASAPRLGRAGMTAYGLMLWQTGEGRPVKEGDGRFKMMRQPDLQAYVRTRLALL